MASQITNALRTAPTVNNLTADLTAEISVNTMTNTISTARAAGAAGAASLNSEGSASTKDSAPSPVRLSASASPSSSSSSSTSSSSSSSSSLWGQEKYSDTVSGLMRKVFSTGLRLNGTPELPYVLQSRHLFEQQQAQNALHASLHEHVSGRTGVRDYCMPYQRNTSRNMGDSRRHNTACLNAGSKDNSGAGHDTDPGHESGKRSGSRLSRKNLDPQQLTRAAALKAAADNDLGPDTGDLDPGDLDAGLEFLRKRDDIWRGRKHGKTQRQVTTTGYDDLDDLLFTGGWPAGTLTEIHCGDDGSGALPLVLPALSRLTDSETHADKWAVWVAPPHVPYAPALRAADINPDRMLVVHPRNRARPRSSMRSVKASGSQKNLQNDAQNDAQNDMVWAVEQALRSGTASVVLAWFDRISFAAMRRLQLAAQAGGTTALIFRPQKAASQNSPAALRLQVETRKDTLEVSVLKQRGAWADDGSSVQLKLGLV